MRSDEYPLELPGHSRLFRHGDSCAGPERDPQSTTESADNQAKLFIKEEICEIKLCGTSMPDIFSMPMFSATGF
jgi:hypothetical protein